MTDRSILDAAIDHHDAGRLCDAQAGYQAVLEEWPDHVEAMQRLGVVRAQQGDLEDAQRLLEQAVTIDPNNYAALDNLGNLRQLLKDYKGAAQSYRRAIDIDPEAPAAFYNLGVVLAKDDDPEGAEAAYRKTIELDSAHYSAHYNLAHLMLRVDKADAAAAVLDTALGAWPDDVELVLLQSDLHRNLEQWQLAATTLRRGIAMDPTRAHLQHLVDAYEGKVPDAPPDEYVSRLFDAFAKDFDARLLLNLDYQVPMTLSALLTDVVGEDIYFDRLLDMGCGTGLSGVDFNEFTDEMHGVDLSEKMLEKAAARNIYAQLSTDGIENYLLGDCPMFDAFVAADVFVYVGNLEGIFRAVAARANAGAHFLFSVEATDSETLELRRTGRYAHPKSYIHRLAADNGFTVVKQVQKPLRMDYREPVVGDYYLLVL